MAHVPAGEDAAAVARGDRARTRRSTAMRRSPPKPTELSYAELRKRERPFVHAARPGRSRAGRARRLRRGVQRRDRRSDALSVAQAGFLSDALGGARRGHAQYRDRWSARSCACSPSSCSGAAIIGWGVLSGFIFMVLDTVDGKLARCTGASSKWGNVFDHGIDLIHPPFWWWAWEHGLAAYGRPLSADLCDHGAVGDHRRLCRAAADRGHVHAPLRRHAHPRLAADRQPVPADHRAAQPEHGDPGRGAAVRPARHRAWCWSRCGRSSA